VNNTQIFPTNQHFQATKSGFALCTVEVTVLLVCVEDYFLHLVYLHNDVKHLSFWHDFTYNWH